MNKMNQIVIEGNVVRTPLFKETPRGTRVCTMPIAVDRMYKDHNGNNVKEVGFYDVEAWGESFGALIEKHGVKGRGVRVVGRLKQNRWKTSDGRSASKIFIVAEHMDFKPLFSQKQGTGAENAAVSISADSESESLQAEIANLEEAAAGIREEVSADTSDMVF